MVKRVLVAGAVFAAAMALVIPASAKGRTTFVVSGGDLTHQVSFDNQRFDSVRGTWWHPESRLPRLEGLRYRLRQYDAGDPALAMEWIYLPDASGALPTGPLASRGLADDGKPIRWIAFSPAFNAEFIRTIRTVAEGDGALTQVAVGLAILLVVTAAGLRLDVIPRWLVRRSLRGTLYTVTPDAGPSFLYTSVPRSLWSGAGHLGCIPRDPLAPQ